MKTYKKQNKKKSPEKRYLVNKDLLIFKLLRKLTAEWVVEWVARIMISDDYELKLLLMNYYC